MAHYAWTDISAGGEVEKREAPGNRWVNVVTKRNIIKRGEKVTQKDVDATDEQWQTMIDGGSVREYPLPEGADEYTSPASVVIANLVDEDGNIDTNKLIEMGLSQPEPVPEEEEAAAAPKQVKADTPKGA